MCKCTFAERVADLPHHTPRECDVDIVERQDLLDKQSHFFLLLCRQELHSCDDDEEEEEEEEEVANNLCNALIIYMIARQHASIWPPHIHLHRSQRHRHSLPSGLAVSHRVFGLSSPQGILFARHLPKIAHTLTLFFFALSSWPSSSPPSTTLRKPRYCHVAPVISSPGRKSCSNSARAHKRTSS